MTPKEAIDALDELVSVDHGSFYREAMQTLKSVVLAQHTNNSAMVSCQQHRRGCDNFCKVLTGHIRYCKDEPCLVLAQHQ